jgi:hypothetical protein
MPFILRSTLKAYVFLVLASTGTQNAPWPLWKSYTAFSRLHTPRFWLRCHPFGWNLKMGMISCGGFWNSRWPGLTQHFPWNNLGGQVTWTFWNLAAVMNSTSASRPNGKCTSPLDIAQAFSSGRLLHWKMLTLSQTSSPTLTPTATLIMPIFCPNTSDSPTWPH